MDGPRACRADELPELLALINLVFRINNGRPPTILADYPHIYRPQNLDNLRVIEIDGSLRASVGTLPMHIAAGETSFATLGVNCTTTHPEWRQRGLGGLLMRDVARQAAELECDLVHLAAGVPEWYRTFHYENGGTVLEYTLNRGNITLLPELREADVAIGLEDHLQEITSLHAEERYGAARTPEQTRTVLSRVASQSYVAHRDGSVSAYVVVRDRDHACIEQGGAAPQAAGLIRAAFQHMDAQTGGTSTSVRSGGAPVLHPTMTVKLGPTQAGLALLLEGLALPLRRAPWHMLYLVDPPRLFGRLWGDRLRVTPAAEENTFQVESDSGMVAYSRRDLVKLAFGPELLRPDMAGIPVPLYAPDTDHL